MKSIKFLGAAGEVTGSSFLVTTDNDDTFLVDLGMFQGSPEHEHLNFEPLDFDTSRLKALFLTHAHIDHCGRLPLLAHTNFKGPIYATAPTRDITEISLYDSAKIAQIEHPGIDTYTKDDVAKVLDMFEIVKYDTPFQVGDLTVTYRDAGHILGSASIEVEENGKTIVFSGDLGNTPQALIKPTEYIDDGRYVLIESTYGDSVHPKEDVFEILQEEINAIEQTDGVLLIPAFSVERAQELLHIIGHLKKDGKVYKETPVYLDSPMAIKITSIFKKYPRMYNAEFASHEHPFEFEGMHFTRSANESKAIHNSSTAKVIIAGSGMMNGGRILHHLHRYLDKPSTRILIVGYQAEGTLGRQIEDGAKYVEVKGDTIPVRANIRRIHSMSSHADQPRLLKWLGEIEGAQRVFIVHGEDDARTALREKIMTDLQINDVELPMKDDIAKF